MVLTSLIFKNTALRGCIPPRDLVSIWIAVSAVKQDAFCVLLSFRSFAVGIFLFMIPGSGIPIRRPLRDACRSVCYASLSNEFAVRISFSRRLFQIAGFEPAYFRFLVGRFPLS